MEELLGARQLKPNGARHQRQANCLEPVQFGQHAWLGFLKVATGQHSELCMEACRIGEPILFVGRTLAGTIRLAITGGTGTEI